MIGAVTPGMGALEAGGDFDPTGALVLVAATVAPGVGKDGAAGAVVMGGGIETESPPPTLLLWQHPKHRHRHRDASIKNREVKHTAERRTASRREF